MPETDGPWRTAVTRDLTFHSWKITSRIIQLTGIAGVECMISFPQPDPDIPLLAPIVNSAGGDILRFLLAEDNPAAITEQ